MAQIPRSQARPRRNIGAAAVGSVLVVALAACIPSAANGRDDALPPIVSRVDVPLMPLTGIDDVEYLAAKMPYSAEFVDQMTPVQAAQVQAAPAQAAPVQAAPQEPANAEFLAAWPIFKLTPPGCASTPAISESMNWFEMAVAMIKAEEGFVADWVDIGDGNWTIGYGHAVSQSEAKDIAGPITAAQAEELLRADLMRLQYIPAVANWFNVSDLSPTMLAALTSFAYNTGPRGFEKYGIPHAGFAEIAQSLEHASDTKTQFPGLLCRRAREAAIIRTAAAVG